MDLSHDVADLVVGVDAFGSESTTEQWAIAAETIVDVAREGRSNIVHVARNSTALAAKQQMEMICHEAVGVHFDAKAFGRNTEQSSEVDPVGVGEKDLLPIDSTIHHVKPPNVVVVAPPSAHRFRLNEGCRTVTSGARHLR